MTPERWNRIAALFDAVADLAPADRSASLARACAGEPALRRAVEGLLEADRAARSDAFLHRIVGDAIVSLAASRERPRAGGPSAR